MRIVRPNSSPEPPDGLFRLRRTELLGWRLACGCSLLSLCLLILGSCLERRVERVWVLSGAGGVYAGPLEPLDASGAFFHESALAASLAALQWSSQGLDLPEIVRLYYSRHAEELLRDLIAERAEDLRARSLSTKPLVQSISDPVADGAARVVEVRGLLQTHGRFSGRALYEEPAFTLTLRFMRNPDLGRAGAYPWVVSDLNLQLPSHP